MSVISGIAGLTSSEVIDLIARNKPDGTAGIYSCKTILNEHRPVCTKEYHLVGNQLDRNNDPDVWYHIDGAGGGTTAYSNRFLTISSGTGTTSVTRCVIDQTKFPINGNFIEVTVRIGNIVIGVGGSRTIWFGFASAFSSVPATERAMYWIGGSGSSFVGARGNPLALTNSPLGRDLAPGDVCTVRLGRQEGSPDIDIVRFYVNGQKVYETLDIPTVDCYAGIGVFSNVDTTTPMSIAIDYFGVKFIP
jgi:hypothetical protein